MKRNLKTTLVMALAMCLLLGNVPFGTMMVCVHAGEAHGEETIHLHYGQLPGQPCDESPEGLTLSRGEAGPWHFFLGQETLNEVRPTVSRSLNHLVPALHPVWESVENGSANIRRGSPFDDPSFVFLDTAFTPTTVLII